MLEDLYRRAKAGEDLGAVKFEGVLRNVKCTVASNGKEFLQGNVDDGVTVQFKAWNNSDAFKNLRDEDQFGSGKAYQIKSYISEFKGNYYLDIQDVTVLDKDPVDYMPKKYDAQLYLDQLMKVLESKVSEKGMKLVDKILFQDADLKKRFLEEFAASSFHDSCVSGLLAHTFKVCFVMARVCEMYKNISRDQEQKDLLMLGALFHDIGKTRELHMGTYTELEYVTHKYLGLEILEKYKDDFIQLYNEEFWHKMVSILLQHHGEHGEPCKTVVSYVVNKVDAFDATLTLLDMRIEGVEKGRAAITQSLILTV